jgi:hypothetical protein
MSESITTPWDDHYMLPAFLGCVSWALTEPDMLCRFREKTGNNWALGRPGLEQMIDRATGADRQFFQQFSDWVADEVFGKPDDADDDIYFDADLEPTAAPAPPPSDQSR